MTQNGKSERASPKHSAIDAAFEDSNAATPRVAVVPHLSAPRWATLVSTFFGVGRLKPGPGTWASIATVMLWAAACSVIPAPNRASAIIFAAAAATLIGIPASTRVVRGTGIKDPSFVVIDEVAGQLISLIGVPLSWKTFLMGLILFRVFDILKPFPIRQLERLHQGTGIMMDDLGAGVLALAIMHLLLHFGLLIR
jgi:phosphatidylglycerophosphatase A